MPNYVTLARVESSSSPGQFYEVKTEGTQLSCNCPGWTRQVHYPNCRQVRQGLSCDCRHRADPELRTARTCKHVRWVEPAVEAAGGIAGAMVVAGSGRYQEDIIQWQREAWVGRVSTGIVPASGYRPGSVRVANTGRPAPRPGPRVTERQRAASRPPQQAQPTPTTWGGAMLAATRNTVGPVSRGSGQAEPPSRQQPTRAIRIRDEEE